MTTARWALLNRGPTQFNCYPNTKCSFCSRFARVHARDNFAIKFEFWPIRRCLLLVLIGSFSRVFFLWSRRLVNCTREVKCRLVLQLVPLVLVRDLELGNYLKKLKTSDWLVTLRQKNRINWNKKQETLGKWDRSLGWDKHNSYVELNTSPRFLKRIFPRFTKFDKRVQRSQHCEVCRLLWTWQFVIRKHSEEINEKCIAA